MANVNIRVDDELKKQAEIIFSELGLSLSTATNVFYRQVVRSGGIPFDMKLDHFYSAKNQTHLLNAIRNYEDGKSKPVIKTLEDLEEMADE